jgi:hypothetical protein
MNRFKLKTRDLKITAALLTLKLRQTSATAVRLDINAMRCDQTFKNVLLGSFVYYFKAPFFQTEDCTVYQTPIAPLACHDNSRTYRVHQQKNPIVHDVQRGYMECVDRLRPHALSQQSQWDVQNTSGAFA